LIAEAAELEAEANRDVKNAQFHRQNEEHHATRRPADRHERGVARGDHTSFTGRVVAGEPSSRHRERRARRVGRAAGQLDRMVAASADPSQTGPLMRRCSGERRRDGLLRVVILAMVALVAAVVWRCVRPGYDIAACVAAYQAASEWRDPERDGAG